MKMLIIAAMDEELMEIKNTLPEGKEENVDDLVVYHTSLQNNFEIYLTKCGIGKVNAAYTAAILCTNYHPNYVFNVGVAGGFKEEEKQLDLVIATSFVYTDVNCTTFSMPPGQILGDPCLYFPTDEKLLSIIKQFEADKKINSRVFYGPVGSGDQFITNDLATINRIRHDFPDIAAVEMEGAAIARVCYRQKVPLFSLRSISDVPVHHGNNTLDFLQTVKISSKVAANICHMLIDYLMTQ